MKIQFKKNILGNAISVVGRAVNAKSPLPILSCIKLQTVGSNLELLAQDLEMGIKCYIPVTVLEEGSCCLPAKYFGEVIKRLPNVDCIIETSGTNAKIVYGSSEITLQGMNSEEYPVLELPSQQNSFSVTEGELKTILSPVVYAASEDTNKGVLSGVLLKTSENVLEAVSTNGHRLALAKNTLGKPVNAEAILPARIVSDLVKQLTPTDKSVEINVTESQVVFKLTDMVLISRLIVGQYVNYKLAIPSGSKTQVKVKHHNLMEAIERAELVAKSGNRRVITLTVQDIPEEPNKANMQVSVISEVGNINEIIKVDKEGDPLTINFDPSYVLEALKNMATEELQLGFNGPNSACTLRPVGDDNRLSLLLPMRIA